MARVLILLASGCEEIEAVTVINICRRAGFEVVSAGLESTAAPVTCSRGTVIIPDSTIAAETAEDFDIIVLPGGQPGTTNLRKDPRVKTLLQKMSDSGKYIAAICAAPMALADAGVLAGKTATSFPGCLGGMDLDDVAVTDQAVVKDGRVITSRGPGTAMDFALKIVSELGGEELRVKVEAGLCR